MLKEDLEQLSMALGHCKFESFPDLEENYKVKVEDLNWKGFEPPANLIKFIDFSKIKLLELDESSYHDFLNMYSE